MDWCVIVWVELWRTSVIWWCGDYSLSVTTETNGQQAASHVMQLPRTEWSLLLCAVINDWMIPFAAYTVHCSRLSMLFSGLNNPQNCPFPWRCPPHWIHGSLGSHTSQPLKTCLHRFSVFVGVTRMPSRQTDILHYQWHPVTIGHTYAMHAMRPIKVRL